MAKWSVFKVIFTAMLGIGVWAFLASPESCANTIEKNTTLKVDAYCSFFHEVGEEVTLAKIPTDFSSLTNVQIKLQQLKAYFNKNVEFNIGLTGINTAAAVNSNSQNYILYNEKFYYKLMQQAGTEWGPLSVFAHEIAHHLENHLLPNQYSGLAGGSVKEQGQTLIEELEADWFSGRILAKMGATQSEATEAVRKVIPEQATATHPARAARLAIIKNGWNSVCNNTSSCSSKAANETDILAIDQFRHDLGKLNPRHTCRFQGQQLLIDNEEQVFWMKFPSHPVGARLPSRPSGAGLSGMKGCRYELALLDEKYCVTKVNGRIVALSKGAIRIRAIDEAKTYPNLCAPCENGLCP